jgi:hypothetical protein
MLRSPSPHKDKEVNVTPNTMFPSDMILKIYSSCLKCFSRTSADATDLSFLVLDSFSLDYGVDYAGNEDYFVYRSQDDISRDYQGDGSK